MAVSVITELVRGGGGWGGVVVVSQWVYVSACGNIFVLKKPTLYCNFVFSFQMVEYIWYTLREYPNLHCNDLCYLKTKQMWIYTVSYSTTVKPPVSDYQNVKSMRLLTRT